MGLDGFEEYDLGSLQTIGAAGERLSADLVRELQEHVCEVSSIATPRPRPL